MLLQILFDTRAALATKADPAHAERAVRALGRLADGDWSPGERVQLAEVIAATAPVRHTALAAARVALLRGLLDQEPADSPWRLGLADALARVLWAQGSKAAGDRRAHDRARRRTRRRRAASRTRRGRLRPARGVDGRGRPLPGRRAAPRGRAGARGSTRVAGTRCRTPCSALRAGRRADGTVSLGRGEALVTEATARMDAWLAEGPPACAHQTAWHVVTLHDGAQEEPGRPGCAAPASSAGLGIGCRPTSSGSCLESTRSPRSRRTVVAASPDRARRSPTHSTTWTASPAGSSGSVGTTGRTTTTTCRAGGRTRHPSASSEGSCCRACSRRYASTCRAADRTGSPSGSRAATATGRSTRTTTRRRPRPSSSCSRGTSPCRSGQRSTSATWAAAPRPSRRSRRRSRAGISIDGRHEDARRLDGPRRAVRRGPRGARAAARDPRRRSRPVRCCKRRRCTAWTGPTRPSTRCGAPRPLAGAQALDRPGRGTARRPRPGARARRCPAETWLEAAVTLSDRVARRRGRQPTRAVLRVARGGARPAGEDRRGGRRRVGGRRGLGSRRASSAAARSSRSRRCSSRHRISPRRSSATRRAWPRPASTRP